MDEARNYELDTVGKNKMEKPLIGENVSKVLNTPVVDELSQAFSRLKHNLNVAHINCQGVSIAHHIEMLAALNCNIMDIVLISETLLNPSTDSNEINLPGFTLIRNDREGGCGGVAIYLRESISYKIISRSSNRDAVSAEHLFIEIIYEETKLLLGVFYNPSSKINYFPHFELLLQRHRSQYEHFICLGDFKTDLLKNNKRSKKLLSIIDDQDIFILPSGPIHVAPNSDPTISDLILVSSLDNVAKSGQLRRCYSCHDILYLSYRL